MRKSDRANALPIVVADPDEASRRQALEALEAGGLPAVEAQTARGVVQIAREGGAALVLTEMILPDMTGLGLVRRFREDEKLDQLPIVMVTRYSEEVDRVLAFDAGVDDFVAKPFSSRELAARIQAILRRQRNRVRRAEGGQPATDPAVAAVARIEWDREPTPLELRIVQHLARRGGRVVSRDQLLHSVWGPGSDRTERVVDAHIKGIRDKLGRSKGHVETVRGVGYRFRGLPGDS